MTAKKRPAQVPSPEQVPSDLGAERALLGLILQGGNAAFERALAAGVRAEDFFGSPNAAIFRTMARLHARSAPIEIASVRSTLEDEGELVLVGGPAGLGAFIE